MNVPYGLIFVTITFFSTMVGGIFALRRTGIDINLIFAFAAGALIGISFFDILPESISISAGTGIELNVLMSVVVLAFLVFHTLDQCILCMHATTDERPGHGPQISGILKAAGLSVHSFLDGVAIGTAFYVTFNLGLLVALAVIFHDFSDGLNTVTVMLRSGSPTRSAFGWLVLDSITPMIGAITAFLAKIPISIIAVILAFFTGEFLYLGATDLLPEAHRHRVSFKLLFATILGIAVMYSTTQLLRTIG